MSTTVHPRQNETADAPQTDRPVVVCLAGNPNVGKSSLFNALTGESRETAHCAGVTVEACSACTRWRERPLEIVDLPGSYALDGLSGDQLEARRALLERRPDVVVAVVDATNLARSLYLPLQLLDLGYRVIVALNLSDEARRRGRMPDVEALSRDLGVPVVATVAPRGVGVAELEDAILQVAAGGGLGETLGTPLPPAVEQRVEEVALRIAARSDAGLLPPGDLNPRAAALAVLEGDADVTRAVGLSDDGFLTHADEALALEISRARHAETKALAAAAKMNGSPADRWWHLTTAPRTGIPIMIAVIAGIFATLFIVGDLLSQVLEAAWAAWISPLVTSAVTGIFGEGPLGKIVLWGVDGGIIATLAVGIPYILTFYFILAFVEDTGYMNAAAFLSDRIMHRFGLHGRAVIPLIAAGGCNVPAIIATRSLGNTRERTIAAVLATLVPCSARTAVIIGAVAGVAGWQYAILTYAVLTVVIILAGLGLNRFIPGDKGILIMEMFPFRRPVLRQVARKTWMRFREFVWDAAPIIVLGSMALGVLYEMGWIWRLGVVLGPIVEGWLMLPMVAGLTLVFAVLRKELALQLLLVFAAMEAGGAVMNIASFMTTSQIVTYAIVNAIYIPCVATIAVLGREVGWRRTAYISAGTIVLALIVGGIIARVLLPFS
ncbi:MAG TPA: ferrous iron transport protein B [Thermoleophilia bacterium]|nr:ferrous iron transport protein B [Thermoleophilia bacterium]